MTPRSLSQKFQPGRLVWDELELNSEAASKAKAASMKHGLRFAVQVALIEGADMQLQLMSSWSPNYGIYYKPHKSSTLRLIGPSVRQVFGPQTCSSLRVHEPLGRPHPTT